MTQATSQALETETLTKTTVEQSTASKETVHEFVKTKFTPAQRRALYLELTAGGREITTF